MGSKSRFQITYVGLVRFFSMMKKIEKEGGRLEGGSVKDIRRKRRKARQGRHGRRVGRKDDGKRFDTQNGTTIEFLGIIPEKGEEGKSRGRERRGKKEGEKEGNVTAEQFLIAVPDIKVL